MTTVYPTQHRKSNYRKVFEAALRLPLAEQRRLREELAQVSEVRLVPPAKSEKAALEGQKLAEEVRAELAKTGNQMNLEQLRGRSWSL